MVHVILAGTAALALFLIATDRSVTAHERAAEALVRGVRRLVIRPEAGMAAR
jgi:hypothetical protein